MEGLRFEMVERPTPPKRTRVHTKPRKRAPYVPKPRRMRVLECANCGCIFEHDRDRAFCSLACKSVADIVRYRRSVALRYEDGVPEDVVHAIRTKMAHTLAGGYDQAARHLGPERRAEVWARDNDRCVLCGEPGEEIDHINDSSDDLANLRLLCKPCHHEVTDSHLVPIADEATRVLALEIDVRVFSPEPVRDCDAPDWSEREAWRRWVRAHERSP